MEKDFWVAFVAFFILFAISLVIQKYDISIAIILVSGFVLQKIYKLDGFLFFYLLKSKFGIEQMKKFSKNKLFSKICNVGFFIAFGLSSLLFRKAKKEDAFGLLILIFLYLSLPLYSKSFVNIFSSTLPPSTNSSKTLENTSTSKIFAFLIPFTIFGFGLFGFTFFSLILSSALIFQMSSKGEKPIPGVMPVIPGFNLPLVSGILSIFVMLSLHEFAHGVLSISKNIKVKSTGLLIAGVLPIGAFVENDENKMEKISKNSQNQILIAGVTANILFSLLLLIPLLLLLVIKAKYNAIATTPVFSFILSFVELSFLLNFMIGATNLFPIPGLDGYKLLQNILGKYSKIFEYATILLFLINLLPFFIPF